MSAGEKHCDFRESAGGIAIGERLQVLRYLKVVRATRNNCGQSDLRIS